MKEALIIIDVQNDYFEGGACELHKAREAEGHIVELIEESRKLDINPDNDTFFIEGTYGCEISDRVKPLPTDTVIVKYCPNSFLGTELNDCLRSLDVEKLIVCGMMTHMCVDTTVRAAMDHGYDVTLVANACATMDLEINGEVIPAETVQKTYIASLAGIFAKIV